MDKEFQDRIIEELKEKFFTDGIDVDIMPSRMVAFNANTDSNISIQFSERLGLNMELEDAYKAHLNGEAFSDIVSSLYNSAKRSVLEPPEFLSTVTDDLYNYDMVRYLLFLQLISFERNKEKLEDVPYYLEAGDLALICRIRLGDGSIVVNNGLLKAYGITKEQLFSDAMTLVSATDPLEVLSMTDMLKKLMPESENMVKEECPLYIVTNTTKIFGAAAILQPGAFDKISDTLASRRFFILPSSVHELIAVPSDYAREPEELKSMVHMVNSAYVSGRDFLSDNIYYYDADEKVFDKYY